ncbi:aquaporin [Penicillium argentinense]|uniref:Aquaporin n=1 Tax=Penicillium argentinense TaxID=1131581 RepID=A0A9W9FE09_9EURO|nr:aquaporin [Penicillium argentinense]KAJ5098424.1 aquaporin [Penicillium argentinense]
MVVAYLPQTEIEGDHAHLEPAIPPFAGCLGGNQDFIVDCNDPKNVEVLEKVPDAAPCMTLAEIFDMRGCSSPDLWKFAMLECIASLMNVFISAWVTTHPLSRTTSPKTEAGIYHTITFISPLFGGITNLLLTPLLIYTFSPSSGGHTLGGALAGFMLHSAYGTRKFTVGGCHIDTSMVPATDGLVIEFVACLVLIFLAFGVALDPRQGKVFGPATGPWFVGVVLGVVSWGTAFTREGYIGASLNPARCFGVYATSEFPTYHCIHWVSDFAEPPRFVLIKGPANLTQVGPLTASIGHGLVYYIDPLWTETRSSP